MIFSFWKKQTQIRVQKNLLRNLIKKIEIPETDKQMFLEAIDICDDQKMNTLYESVSHFIQDLEIKKVENISKTSFVKIESLSKKDAEQKKKELNSYNFLLTNI